MWEDVYRLNIVSCLMKFWFVTRKKMKSWFVVFILPLQNNLSSYQVCSSEKGQQGFTTILCFENDFKLPIPRNSKVGQQGWLYSCAGNQKYIEDVWYGFKMHVDSWRLVIPIICMSKELDAIHFMWNLKL